jgi:hypothetical protein
VSGLPGTDGRDDRSSVLARLQPLDRNSIWVFDERYPAFTAGGFLRLRNDLDALAAKPLDRFAKIAFHIHREMFDAIAHLIRRVGFKVEDELDLSVPIFAYERHIGVSRVVVRAAEQLQT